MIRRRGNYEEEYTAGVLARGRRVTRERLAVVRTVFAEFRDKTAFSSDDVVTAVQAIQTVQEKPRRIARSTIYRTLLQLVEFSLLFRPDPEVYVFRVPDDW